MIDRYSRNRIYLNLKEQEVLKSASILLAGAGIGSVIAECMLRLGFENLTIIDGDTVEVSNLNRQNYQEDDVAINKVDALKKRLLAINSQAKITVVNIFLTPQNIEDYIKDFDIAINALDFDTDVPLIFDELCQKKNIPVLHPYNLGWAGLVTVIHHQNAIVENSSEKVNEVNIVANFVAKMRENETPEFWLEEVIHRYKNEETKLSPPQLSVGSWLVASICTQIAYDILLQNPVKFFPEYYYLTSKLSTIPVI